MKRPTIEWCSQPRSCFASIHAFRLSHAVRLSPVLSIVLDSEPALLSSTRVSRYVRSVHRFAHVYAVLCIIPSAHKPASPRAGPIFLT